MTGTRMALFAVALGTVLSACGGPSGPPPDPRQVKLQNEIRSLRSQKAKLQQQVKSAAVIEKALDRNQPVVVAAIGAKELHKAYKSAMPLSFPASRLSSYVSGTVVVRNIRQVKLDGTRGRFVLEAKGKNIKFTTSVPPGYQKMARELKQALSSGITINVKGEINMGKGNQAVFTGKAREITLKKHNKTDYQNMVRKGINDMLRKPHPIDFESARAGGKNLRLRNVTKGKKNMLFVFSA